MSREVSLLKRIDGPAYSSTARFRLPDAPLTTGRHGGTVGLGERWRL
jgi:hypothetical protein